MKRLRGVLLKAGPASPPGLYIAGPSLSGRLRPRSNSSITRSLYTSSSPLSFFESGVSPPTSRSHVVARLEARLEAEIHGSYTPTNSTTHPSQGHSQAPSIPGSAHSGAPFAWSMAVTSPYSLSSTAPYGLIGIPPLLATSPHLYPSSLPTNPPATESSKAHRRSRSRYRLDAGAYGIPKHRSAKPVSSRQAPMGETYDLELAVSVGEDAYFIRENAMGVADGVGGWAHSTNSRTVSHGQSASALFSRRLMHFCSAEIECADRDWSPTRSRRRSRSYHRSPAAAPARVNSYRSPSPSRVYNTVYSTAEQLVDELEESLEDLGDGIDVLMILEKAYESALKAHVVPATGTITPPDPVCGVQTSSPPRFDSTNDPNIQSITPPFTLASSVPSSTDEVKPLMAGSSTALVAILDHLPKVPSNSPSGDPLNGIEDQAILRIAHLGDSMGMLIRGDEIVWRSEEMWSKFNTPFQLGPCSQTTPKDARTFTVPVEADDILILATDGLSDNLWDEDIVDEVVRFRRSFLQDRAPETIISDSCETGLTHPEYGLLGRKTLASMLSEALCSRARRVAERGHGFHRSASNTASVVIEDSDEIPFACRARAHGHTFHGGKADDISVVVAVISPNL